MPLQITRRGRLVVTILVAAAVAAACLVVLGGLGSGPAVAGSQQARQPLRQMLVLPGDTLWSIAEEVDPDADRRDVVLEIRRINDLPTSGVMAGQSLLLPAR